MDAILRCEGDREACADPQANPSLARAAEAARAAGASDGVILEAIALARDGESAWEVTAPAPDRHRRGLVVVGPPDEALGARGLGDRGHRGRRRPVAAAERIAAADARPGAAAST